MSSIPLACAVGIWGCSAVIPLTYYHTPTGALLPWRFDLKSSRVWVGWSPGQLCVEWGETALCQFSLPNSRSRSFVLVDVTTSSFMVPSQSMHVSTRVGVPTWLIMLIVSLWPLARIVWLRALTSAEACPACGYSLCGLTPSSARCPECGEPIAWKALNELRVRE